MKAHPVPEHWDAFRQSLRTSVTPITWQTWLEPLWPISEEDGEVVLAAPSEFHLRWVTEKFDAKLTDVAREVYGSEARVVLEARPSGVPVDEADEAPLEEDPGPPPKPSPAEAAAEGFAPKYSFENFVVGPSNRFAHAAAMAVGEQPGRHYNPLFIYGPAGLGKTHLLHAVGHHTRELHRGHGIRYVSSENFFNEFIDGIRRKRMDEFKNRYRNVDVLLLDDVQFFEGKEQILEEFFHTFNSLHQAGKQLVITSDRHPKHLSTLEDRLRSRFEWGLLTDIQPPDVETRLAILKRNADFAPQPVPTTVLEFIAQHVSDNIRELEGALTRVTAYAALTQQDITIEMATDVLQDLIPQQKPRQKTPEEIIAATSLATAIDAADLVGSSRKRPIVRARQIAMYLCREITDLSLPKIGAMFGGRDHTTVLHALDKIRELMKTDKEVFDQVTALMQNLRGT